MAPRPQLRRPRNRPCRSRFEPIASGLSLRLHRQDGAAPDDACAGPCVVQVVPGRYDLAATDARGQTTRQSLELLHPETIEIRPTHRGRATTGAGLLATGAVLAAGSAGLFVYGAVNNLEASGCDGPCGAVSGHFLRESLVGLGVGLALAAVGGVLVFGSDQPSVIERPTPTF